MGIRVIRKSDEPDTIPCNVCDGEYTVEHYEGTKSGICKTCRSKLKSGDIETLYYIVDVTRESYKKQKKEWTWFHVREMFQTLYYMILDKNFVNNLGPYLERFGLLSNEIADCVKAYIRIKTHGV